MDSRIETLLKALLNGDSVEDFTPQSRAEHYLKNCILQIGVEGLPDPQSRLDALLYQLAEMMPNMGGGEVLPTQTKTITPAISEQSVTPDSGYKLTKVIIQAVTSAIDANIKAENILEGVSILGVEGSDKGYEVGKAEGIKAGKQSVWSGIQENGKRVSYNSFLYQTTNIAEWFYPEFPIAPTTMQAFARDAKPYNSNALFDFAERIAECGIPFDLSNATEVGYCFYNARFSRVPVLNLSKATKTTYMFGSYVETVDKVIATEDTVFKDTFNSAVSLEHIIFEGVIAMSLNMKDSSKLDINDEEAKSILSIFRSLKRYATGETGHLVNTLTLHQDVWNRINELYPNGTDDMPLADGETWQDYILSIGWGT